MHGEARIPLSGIQLPVSNVGNFIRCSMFDVECSMLDVRLIGFLVLVFLVGY